MRKLAKLISFILSVLFFITMYLVYRLNILPLKYFLAIGIVLLLLVLGLDFKLIRKKTGPFSRGVFSLFSIVLIGGICYLLTYINATYDFMNSMVLKDYEVVKYDVISSGNYTKIKDLNDKNLSYLKTDNNYDKLKFLIRKDISYNANSISDISSLIDNLSSNKTDAIILEDSYYNLLKEEYNALENTKVVKSYKLIVKSKKEKSTKTTTSPFVLYISGIDTYGEISSVSRSDVNILAVVNPSTEKILLVSIPRDYYVKLHGTEGYNDKLTHAGLYGVSMSVNTLEDLLSTNIDYYLRLNFSTLTKSIDLMGGIDVYSDKTFTPWTNKNMTIVEGVNHMDGEMALAFARERHAYASGDRHRGENQQKIITAMIEKMTDKSNIGNYKKILSSLEGTFETSMSYKDISNLFKMQISRNIKWNITSISLDGTGSMQKTYSMGNRNLYVMIPDQTTVDNAKLQIKNTLEEK